MTLKYFTDQMPLMKMGQVIYLLQLTGDTIKRTSIRCYKQILMEVSSYIMLEKQHQVVSLTGGAAANITALSDGATITIDMATACHHSVTLGGNRTFAAPSNQVVGQAGSIFITQDGTGSRTASFNSAFKFVGGTAPTLTTTASATDRIDYIIKSSNVIHCAVSLDVK